MKVLITGANGFVGKHCCAAFKAVGIQAIAPSSKELDITRPFRLQQHFDAVLHLAAYNITSVGDRDEGMYARVNVDGTKHVVESVSCDQFIFLSTTKLYDPTLSAYAQSKAAAEDVCRKYFMGEGLVFIRSSNILGPGQAPKAVLPVFMEQAKRNLPLDLIHNPQTPITYIDVRDLVQVILKVLARPKSAGVYNVTYPQSLTLQELALKVIAACGSSSKINITGELAPVMPILIDCKRTWDSLGFKPRYDIDQVIANILSPHGTIA